MEEIQRQKNQSLKKAVELAASGQFNNSLEMINNVVEIQDNEKRQLTIANYYLKLPANDRDHTIIVTGTNKARRDINNKIRRGLKLEGCGMEISTLTRRDITKAESKYSKNYHIGDIIQVEKDYLKTGLKRNGFYKIENTGLNNRLTVRAKSGEYFEFNPITHQKLSVYQHDCIELSVGDMVRITHNDSKRNLINGDRLRVKELQKDHILLTDDRRQIKLPINKPVHIDYAYATTIHSSQGLTAERVLIDINTKTFTTTKDIYYVAISRGSSEARIYTNSIKELPKAIIRENVKSTALDIIKAKIYKNKER